MTIRRIPAWFLPAIYLFLLPFGNLFLIPLIIMMLFGLFNFYSHNVTKKIEQFDAYKYLLIVFGLLWLPMLFSLPDAINFKHSLKTTLGVLPYIIVGFYLLDKLDNLKVRHKLRIAIIVITTAWCLDALLQWVYGTNILGRSSFLPTHLSGIFSPKSTLGLVLAVLLPVVLEGLREMAKNIPRTLLALVLGLIHINVILLSGSRTAFLMLILGVFGWLIYIFYINSIYSWQKILPMIVLVIATVGFISYQQPARIIELQKVFNADSKTLDKMSGGRFALWDTARKISLDHWFNGIGPRGFRYAYDDYRPEQGKYVVEYPRYGSTHPHFALLEIMTETGAIGLVSIFAAVFLLFGRLRHLSKNEKLSAFPWLIGATIAIIPNFAKAFYSSFWLSFMLWMIFIGLANTNRGET